MVHIIPEAVKDIKSFFLKIIIFGNLRKRSKKKLDLVNMNFFPVHSVRK